MKRIESIDYLRGLMALSVVVYHYVSWYFNQSVAGSPLDSGGFLSRLGIYAVSMFYIISGLSLYIAYQGRLKNISDALAYSVKRIFRIFPLFWLVFTIGLLLQMVAAFVNKEDYSFPLYEAILNYTLIFGFIDPSAYLTVGAWSIGNEMVFYAIFLIVMLASVRLPLIIPASILASVAIGAWFAYSILNSNSTLTEQWGTYINPLNQVLLFFLGVGVAKYAEIFRDLIKRKSAWLVLFIFGVGLFCFYPISGDRISLVTGHARMLLVASCTIIVLAVYMLDPQFRASISKPLKFLGETSYSIYLMHPVVAWPITFVGNRAGLDLWVSYSVALVATLFVGWLTYKYLELPMMKKGKSLLFVSNSPTIKTPTPT